MKNINAKLTRLVLKFALTAAVTLCLGIPYVGDAQATDNELKGYSAICKKVLTVLNRDVNSFSSDFGQPLSKKVEKYKDAITGDVDTVTTLAYRDSVTMKFEAFNRNIAVRELVLGSASAVKKEGFDAKTAEELKKLYGKPDEETPGSLKYSCDAVTVIFTTLFGQLVAVRINSPAF